jgi:IS5 family transposase
MLRNRYDPYSLFEAVPRLGLRFDPELAELDRLLDDEPLFRLVRDDLARRYPHTTETGRPSTPVEVVLRLLVVKRLYGWSYADTVRFVSDSLVLRQFCRLGLEPAPDRSTLLRWAGCVRPGTLHALLDRVVELAAAARVTRGRKLRTDGAVVQTDVHPPSDSSLLADGVRVVSRLVGRARRLLGAAAGRLFRDRTRAAKRLSRAIGQATARAIARGEPRVSGAAARRPLYRRLLAVARASLGQAAAAGACLAAAPDTPAGARLRAGLARVAPLLVRVVEQTVERALRGGAVPAAQKVCSLFEPHTAVIQRGKVRTPTEFGRKLWLDEVEGGIVTRYAVLAGNPPDAPNVPASLAHHRARFGRPPHLLAADRGTHSPDNEHRAAAAGVRRVCLPKPGHRTPARVAHERQRWFRRAQRWRGGIEGRISLLLRRFGLRRCRDHGADGMERWVGWGVIAHNLRVIARHRPRPRAA